MLLIMQHFKNATSILNDALDLEQILASTSVSHIHIETCVFVTNSNFSKFDDLNKVV